MKLFDRNTWPYQRTYTRPEPTTLPPDLRKLAEQAKTKSDITADEAFDAIIEGVKRERVLLERILKVFCDEGR